MLMILVTSDQLQLLVQIVDNADIKGRAAALVVSIQQALASAAPVETVESPTKSEPRRE